MKPLESVSEKQTHRCSLERQVLLRLTLTCGDSKEARSTGEDDADGQSDPVQELMVGLDHRHTRITATKPQTPCVSRSDTKHRSLGTAGGLPTSI